MNKRGTLLIVDDDADILSMMKLILSGRGFDVSAINNGDIVHVTAQQLQPNVIILDMLLSGKDGRTIITRLKQDELTSNIPVIMISAHPQAKSSCLYAGANEFLSKPFNLKDLFEKIEICMAPDFIQNSLKNTSSNRSLDDELR